MKQGKTGREWYKMLTATEKKQFRHNYDIDQLNAPIKDYLDKEHDNFYDFISDAFIFDETKQGHQYWRDISNRKGQ